MHQAVWPLSRSGSDKHFAVFYDEDMHQFMILAFIIFTSSFPLQAEDDESVREACRKQIAGAYLTTYNQWARTKDYLSLLSSQQKKLKKAKISALQVYEKSRQEVEQHEYDVERQRAFSAAKDRWDNIKVQLKEITQLAEKTKVETAMAEQELTKLKTAIKPVFSVQSAVGKASQFPYRLDFKSPCPKYRYTCPLPNKDAYHLRDIPIAGKECLDYVKFSVGMNRK